MIKVAICDDDIQFIYKIGTKYFSVCRNEKIKVDVDGYTSGAEFNSKTAAKRKV